jgi:hypothetical protein
MVGGVAAGAFQAATDCIPVPNLGVDSQNRPKLKAEPGYFSMSPLGHQNNNRTVYIYRRDAAISAYETTAGRLACALAHGPPPVKCGCGADGGAKLQASHLCHERSRDPLCASPAHLVWECDTCNKDRRGCRYGSKPLCPHKPKCIWEDSIRNSEDLGEILEALVPSASSNSPNGNTCGGFVMHSIE